VNENESPVHSNRGGRTLDITTYTWGPCRRHTLPWCYRSEGGTLLRSRLATIRSLFWGWLDSTPSADDTCKSLRP